MASVQIKLFASLKDVVGHEEVNLECPAGSNTRSIFLKLSQKFPQLKSFESSIMPAVNQSYVSWNDPVSDGDEVAFIPPVSGG